MLEPSILVIGVAGFIGFHVPRQLLAEGHRIVGLDSLNDYYDPALKLARLKQLEGHPRFAFVGTNLAERPAMGRCPPSANSR